MHYDINNFCDNEKVCNYYSAKDPIDIAYVSARKLLNNKKSFRLVSCNIYNYYFIPKTSHTTLYFDDIYKDEKLVKNMLILYLQQKSIKLMNILKNYKNLNKQDSLKNNPIVFLLYEKRKIAGTKILEKYQRRQITGQKFEN